MNSIFENYKPNKKNMARKDDSGVIVMSIIGFIVLIILIIGEAFKGNFTPLFVVMGIILLIYIFIKITELRQHKIAKDKINVDVNPEGNFNFPRFILILLLLGFFIGGFFLNKFSSSNVGNETVLVEEPMHTPEIIDSAATVAEVPKEIKWINNDFVNTVFQIPENLILDKSSSSNNSKLYIDFVSNISMTIVADYLSDEMMDKISDDFLVIFLFSLIVSMKKIKEILMTLNY